MKKATHRRHAVHAVEVTARMAYTTVRHTGGLSLKGIPVALLWDEAIWAPTRRERKAAKARFVAALAALAALRKGADPSRCYIATYIDSYISRDGGRGGRTFAISAKERKEARDDAQAVYRGARPRTYGD